MWNPEEGASRAKSQPLSSSNRSWVSRRVPPSLYAMARPLEYWAATEPRRSRDPRAVHGGARR
jgi:hypothetical protein